MQAVWKTLDYVACQSKTYKFKKVIHKACLNAEMVDSKVHYGFYHKVKNRKQMQLLFHYHFVESCNGGHAVVDTMMMVWKMPV